MSSGALDRGGYRVLMIAAFLICSCAASEDSPPDVGAQPDSNCPCMDVYGHPFDDENKCISSATEKVGCYGSDPSCERGGLSQIACLISPDATVLVRFDQINDAAMELEELGWTPCTDPINADDPQVCGTD